MGAFENKTVLITGASSGFGAAFAKVFAREGARLINISRRKVRLEALADTLRNQYGTETLSLDINVADAKAVTERLSNLPGPFAYPDILINNAGLVKGLNKVWETTPAEWDEMIDVNVKGVLNISSLIIPKMLEKNGGHIINISSISGYDTYPGGGVYCATKFAVRALTDTLRKELVDTPIRVSMISPGMAKTEFSEVRFKGDKARADKVYENFDPLLAEDVAEMALFIASRPPHVNIADIIVYPTQQASVSLIHRETLAE